MKLSPTFPGLLACSVAILLATSARANNLVANGSFEDGTYTSTVGGYTNSNVPIDWTPNAGFDLEPPFNQVRSAPESGSYNLSIGNYDYQPVPALSQSFADVLGDTYDVSFWARSTSAGNQPNGGGENLDVTVGAAGVSLPNSSLYSSYQNATFTFVGTGWDTLTISGNNSPGEWYVDNVVVTGAAAVPEVGNTIYLLIVSGIALGLVGWKTPRNATVIAMTSAADRPL